MKEQIMQILNVISANIFILFISILQAFLLPILLGPEEYGYWAFYLLCIGYACFVMFGFCDGFYLDHGGERYDEIDKQLFSSLHFILFIYLIIILTVWTISVLMINDEIERTILVLVGISGILACEVSYFSILSQTTARFKIYAKGNIIEKTIVMGGILFYFFWGNTNALGIIAFSILGKGITLIYYLLNSYDIITIKPNINIQTFKASIGNIKSGFPLTLSAICAGLITGIGRFVVKENLGISELGYYSLAYSFSAIFTQIIAAIAVVFFPLFKRINEKRATIILADIDFLISAVGVISLILYYPGYLLIKNIFPNFLESLGCILYIIPIVICQARISIVYNTIYKVLLMQKQMVVTVLIAVIFCLVATQVAFEIYPTKEAVMGMAYISYVIWITATLAILHKKKNIRSSILSIDIVVSMLFVMINLHFGFSWRAFIISIILILVALIININKLINCFRGVKIAMDSA